MHQLQICPIVHNQGASPTTPRSYIRVHAIVWACGCGQTDTQTRVTTIHFASSATLARCSYVQLLLAESVKIGPQFQLALLAGTSVSPSRNLTVPNLARYRPATVFLRTREEVRNRSRGRYRPGRRFRATRSRSQAPRLSR